MGKRMDKRLWRICSKNSYTGQYDICVAGKVFKDKRYAKVSLLLLKYKPDGTLISAHEYTYKQGIDIYIRKIETLNNHLYLSGDKYDFNKGEYSALLCKFDSNLNRVWERTFRETANQAFNSYSGMQIHRNHIYVAGFIFYYKKDSCKMLLAKYDLDGNLKWRKIHENKLLLAADLKIFNNKIYVCGLKGTSFYKNSDFNSMIARIAEYFNLSVKVPGNQYWVEVDGAKKQGPEADFYLPAGTYKVHVTPAKQDGETRYVFKNGATDQQKTREQ